jgi:hypothetical protein
MLKNINLTLKFGKNESYHENRTAHCYIVTSLFLKTHKELLIATTLFTLSKSLYSRSVRLKGISNFSSIFQNHLDLGIYETYFPKHVSFVVLHFLLLASL